jgi:hypothetical protein
MAQEKLKNSMFGHWSFGHDVIGIGSDSTPPPKAGSSCTSYAEREIVIDRIEIFSYQGDKGGNQYKK